ncbi:MAG: hypothetical protein V4615_02850 [Bacteroidota bacterium]
MQKIDSEIGLRDAILKLESTQAVEVKMLKEQFHLAYESVKPLNFIKSTFKEAAESRELKDHLIDTSVGLAAGYLSKALFQGISNNPLRKLLGSALMFGVTNVVSRHPDTVRAVGRQLIKIITTKPVDRVTEIRKPVS